MIELDFLRVIGIIYLSIGISAFVDANYMKSLFADFAKEKLFLFLAGILTTVLGYILIINTFESSLQYATLVYILGIITFIKGIFLIICPKIFNKIAEIYTNKHVFCFIRVLLIFIGIVCIYITVL